MQVLLSADLGGAQDCFAKALVASSNHSIDSRRFAGLQDAFDLCLHGLQPFLLPFGPPFTQFLRHAAKPIDGLSGDIFTGSILPETLEQPETVAKLLPERG